MKNLQQNRFVNSFCKRLLMSDYTVVYFCKQVPSPKGCKRKQKEKDFYRRVRFNQKQAERARQICLFDRKLELDALRSFRVLTIHCNVSPCLTLVCACHNTFLII